MNNSNANLIDRHCSQCLYYEILANFNMYCHYFQKRITARKKPCGYYKERKCDVSNNFKIRGY